LRPINISEARKKAAVKTPNVSQTKPLLHVLKILEASRKAWLEANNYPNRIASAAMTLQTWVEHPSCVPQDSRNYKPAKTLQSTADCCYAYLSSGAASRRKAEQKDGTAKDGTPAWT